MLGHIAIGAVLFLMTTLVHAGFTIFTFWAIRHLPDESWFMQATWREVLLIAILVLTLFVALLFESGLWAIVYAASGALDGIEPAFYFSVVTFTTLSYGDVVLDEEWRVMATFEAANGIIMLGWSTALVMTAVRHAYKRDLRRWREK